MELLASVTDIARETRAERGRAACAGPPRVAALCGLLLAACSSQSSPPTSQTAAPAPGKSSPRSEQPEAPMTESSAALSVTCRIARQDDNEVYIAVEAVNRRDHEIHIIDSDKLPYLLREPDGTVLALYGVNAPDPELDYYGIDIPLTRPLGPGGRFESEFRLIPLVLRDHYSFSSKATPVQGTLRLVCRLAYGRTAIDQARRNNMAINALMEWQQWVEAPALEVPVP
jgi:hypothetical protein